mmetsp:Transcript_1700/g.6446  ORF Transcript_1700/g.6446 Transcript_1700/m.6446 type:complete len:209 (-) Transcript_1700:1621-2247(-)
MRTASPSRPRPTGTAPRSPIGAWGATTSMRTPRATRSSSFDPTGEARDRRSATTAPPNLRRRRRRAPTATPPSRALSWATTTASPRSPLRDAPGWSTSSCRAPPTGPCASGTSPIVDASRSFAATPSTSSPSRRPRGSRTWPCPETGAVSCSCGGSAAARTRPRRRSSPWTPAPCSAWRCRRTRSGTRWRAGIRAAPWACTCCPATAR